ncbi:hypothetical protein GYMLUDRAFT_37718 [Collybiopsis luxurians FD-317 M1]|nr:hypothetical protein GYMLUDRAFT_37718 [Collybiopsis luxurians FD-317 M1]
MVNAETPVLSRIKGVKQGTTIRGLLGRRQEFCPSGYGVCDNNSDLCCPLGGQCCDVGGCCNAGHYCVIGTNGLGGCCPDGELCSGPAPGGGGTTTIEETSTHTIFSTSTSFFSSTSFSTFSTPTTHSSQPAPSVTPTSVTSQTSVVSSSAGSPTFFAPQTTPSADLGYTNVFVPGSDPKIAWSTNHWNDASSSCDSSKECRKTTTDLASFTYFTDTNSSGASLYLDVHYELAEFDVYVNNEKLEIDSFDVTVCAFYSVGHLPDSNDEINITVVVTGPLTNGRRQVGSDNSFEFNGFMLGQRTSTAGGTSSAAGSTSSVGGGLIGNSAPGQSNPARAIAATVIMALIALIVL